MDRVYLLKLGELVLKGDNQASFVYRLRADIRNRLRGSECSIKVQDGRFFVYAQESHAEVVEHALAHTPGITGYALAYTSVKEIGAILSAVERAVLGGALDRAPSSFKVEARRADKSFPLDSYAIACQAGARVLALCPKLRVDLRDPDFTVRIEVRDKAYVYAQESRGIRGLPLGSSGRGLLLLSGGIDSPVAGYLMGLRGLELSALHFHAYPYTSEESVQKVRDLAQLLSLWIGRVRLYLAPFTEVQSRIKARAKENETTLMMRAAMVSLADSLAKRLGLGCLVSGESLGQVASQTMESMRFTGSYTDLPLFRPLVGTDKQATVNLAKTIGSFDISVRPYEDCCVLFSPKHPILKPDFAICRANYEGLGLSEELEASMAGIRCQTYEYGREATIPS